MRGESLIERFSGRALLALKSGLNRDDCINREPEKVELLCGSEILIHPLPTPEDEVEVA